MNSELMTGDPTTLADAMPERANKEVNLMGDLLFTVLALLNQLATICQRIRINGSVLPADEV